MTLHSQNRNSISNSNQNHIDSRNLVRYFCKCCKEIEQAEEQPEQPDGRLSSLHLAAKKGHWKVVTELLEAKPKAKIDQLSEKGWIYVLVN